MILTKSHREVKSFTTDLSTWSPNVYRTMMQSSTRTMGSFLSFILSHVGSGVTHHKEGCAHRCRVLIDYLSLNLSLLAKTAIMLYCADVGFPHPPTLETSTTIKHNSAKRNMPKFVHFLQRHNVSDENTACQKTSNERITKK